jgi:ribonucleoside-triphosphate reductase
VFNVCPKCGSKNIKRLRRVSGYLEITDYFTSGKKNEFKRRKENDYA